MASITIWALESDYDAKAVKYSPKIAKFIEINSETLKRNNSLRRLRRLIAQCES